MTRVLVIGGYGTFGRRLVHLLSQIEGLQVWVAGRSASRAQAAIDALDGPASLHTLALDRSQPLPRGLAFDVVVDAVGPFQGYGAAADYVLDACEAWGACYVDLSDDPAFCAHMLARAGDSPVTVATGWSTFSAVTGAVHHALGGGLPLASGIVPSPRLPMGRAVIDSVLSYAGRPLPGSGAPGLTRTVRRTVAPPGTTPMRALLFSNVATPDAVLLDPDATGWVAPQPEILHRALIVLARLARWRLMPPLRLFGPLIHGVQARLRLGEPRGGLWVESGGRRWDLVGEGETGPYVPVIPAAALITALHAGESFAPGPLRPGEDFPLERLTAFFDRLGIRHGEREAGAGLYDRALGGAMARLPEQIQRVHDGGTFSGRAVVERGRNPLGRGVARLLRLPPAGEHDLRVSIHTDARGREVWRRDYDGHAMVSVQQIGTGRSAHTVVERFGPFAVFLGLAVEDDRLVYRTRGWSVFGLPLPFALRPRGEVFETVDAAGRFTFHVDMQAPGFGRLVRYRGWLAPEGQDGAPRPKPRAVTNPSGGIRRDTRNAG